jgi:hypothetical protein
MVSREIKIIVKKDDWNFGWFFCYLFFTVLVFTGDSPTIFESLKLIFAHWAGITK